jgi:hypothetical protein
MSHHLEENSSFASEIRENNYVNAGNTEQFDVVVVGGRAEWVDPGGHDGLERPTDAGSGK